MALFFKLGRGYGLFLIAVLSMAACEEESGGESAGNENTPVLCEDHADNDGDGAVDCADAECSGLEVCAAPQDPDVSGMPLPPATDVPRPAGPPGNLAILDWAGFRAALTYSFDDTHPSHLEHYDALQATGVKVTFFAVNETATDIEGWRRAAADGHEIGNHTAHHCRAGLSEGCAFGTPLESPEAEIAACSDYIVANFGQPGVWTMAAPYGEYWWSLYAGDYVLLNRTVTSGAVLPNEGIDPLKLPSVMLPGGAGAAMINENIDGAHAEGSWLIFCIHALLPTEDGSGGIHVDEITRSIRHGQSLGDLWIDSMINVGAYWMGQRILSSVTPAVSGDQTVWTWTLPNHFPPGKYLRVTVTGGTPTQGGKALPWSLHGYYEVALDAGELTLANRGPV